MQKMSGFANNLLLWYGTNKRDLPWREVQDPYRIWVSEIILQQTRVQQGLPYYERFIIAYPTVVDLARAPIEEVLRLWQGLGYYSRARNMHQAATYVVEKLDGKFPPSFESLLLMKGVGRYTAAAVASFAYKEKVPVVDGNVQRVLARVFGVESDIGNHKTQRLFENIAMEHIPADQPDIFNQAIMEFGALYCVPVKPDCERCVFKTSCFAFQRGVVAELPLKLKKTKVRNRYFHYVVLRRKGKIAFRERGSKDIWIGLNEFYLIESDRQLTQNEVQNAAKQEGVDIERFDRVSSVYLHVLSHQKLYATFYSANDYFSENIELKGFKFFSEDEIERLPKPVLIVKYLGQENFF